MIAALWAKISSYAILAVTGLIALIGYTLKIKRDAKKEVYNDIEQDRIKAENEALKEAKKIEYKIDTLDDVELANRLRKPKP